MYFSSIWLRACRVLGFDYNLMTSKYIKLPTNMSNNAENISISFLNFESSIIMADAILKIKKKKIKMG